MTTLYPPGDVRVNEAYQTAQSIKYSSALVWFFAEIAPDVFCLYDFQRNVVAVVDTWDEVLQYYRARPPYVPPASRARTTAGIDLSKLDIKL